MTDEIRDPDVGEDSQEASFEDAAAGVADPQVEPLPVEVLTPVIPKDVARAMASLWKSGLKAMKEMGMYSGEIPEFFTAECTSDGSLSLCVMEMPKGVIVVPDDNEGTGGFPGKTPFDPTEKDRRTQAHRLMESRRSLVFDAEGGVDVEEKG